MKIHLVVIDPQNDWQHYDDFAVAGLVLDPPGATPCDAGLHS